MDFAIFWLAILGPILIGAALAIWGFADGSKTFAIWLGFFGCVLLLIVLALQLQKSIVSKETEGVGTGGKGGQATASDGGVALGGKGGRGGVGSGGTGGNADAVGERSMAIGGDGGDSGRSDGRGGNGGQSPLKNLSPEMLKSWGLTGNEGYGQGGRGANSPEYDRNLKVLNSISSEYMANNPNAKLETMPGVLMPPINWVNNRLSQRRETFRVEFIDNGTDFLLHTSDKK